MDSKIWAAVGIVAIIATAVAIIGGYAAFGHENDSGDSEDPGKTTLEYSYEIVPIGTDSCTIEPSFYARESGSIRVYIGDDLIGDYRWHEPLRFHSGGWVYDFGPGEDLAYVQANLRIEFSSNFDPVLV